MSVIEIVVIIACAVFVGFVIVKSIINRKKGKTCCSDCSHCNGCSHKVKNKNGE